MNDLTPQQIVAELDKHIVGQNEAKRAVAIAVRNRWRRQQLPEAMRAEVGPKNILMAGPTGVGKTEIARRLAKLVNAPFIKVEASKYTEVGYHGRDVESMVRDLLDLAIHMVRAEQAEVVRVEADRRTEEQLLDALLPAPVGTGEPTDDADAQRRRTREKFRQKLRDGELEDNEIEIAVEGKAAAIPVMATIGADQIDPQIQDFLDKLMPSQQKRRRLPLREARKIIHQQVSDTLIDREKVIELARQRTENTGIIFIDEIDKIAASGKEFGPDISRQGVQRDLLPIVEGSTVSTRHGMVRTDHVLFIAAGAFHNCKPSDLMPELQGRFPIRVELSDLSKEDFIRILTQPQTALIRQQIALMATEGVQLEFTPAAIETMAELAHQVNRNTVNIGARRLYTTLEKVMEDLSFDAPARQGQRVVIDADEIRTRLADIIQHDDLSRFIL